jgi:predicted nucleic acid-binding protein
VDASVVVKWCVPTGESRTAAAQALLAAHLNGTIHAAILDLTYYEVGNALVGKGLTGPELAATLDLLRVWDLHRLDAASGGEGALVGDLVARYELSFYDAGYLAAAIVQSLPLVTDDRALLLAASDEGVGIALGDVTS